MSDDSSKVSVNTNGATTGSAADALRLSRNDMIDMPEDFDRWPFLHHVLGEYRDLLTQTYLESDRASLAAQANHRRWVLCAAVTATLAVSFAIVQLAGIDNGTIVVLESIAVIAAALAFWRGHESRKEWLKERHRAEQCRFFKFGSLVSADLQEQGGPPLKQRLGHLGDGIKYITGITYEGLVRWLAEDSMPSPPGRISPRSLEELRQCRDYYRERRLKFQAAYFKKKQSEKRIKRDDLWRRVPPLLFVASVVIVGVHAVVTFFIAKGWIAPAHKSNLVVAIASAALLPVFGSGIRTWRSAHEATRNMNRFRAKYVALENISKRLEADQIKDDVAAEAVVRDLWCSEQIMESEHREWLRLMIDAEWMA